MKKFATRSNNRVNLDDVARLAGVSPITVSRCLRSPDIVAKRTRDKIRAAISQLGYVPDLVAASLASNRSNVIALIVPTITNSIFAESIQGTADSLHAAGYQLIIGDSGYSDDVEIALTEAMLGRRADGLILLGNIGTSKIRQLLENADIPIVQIWEIPEQQIDSAIGFSNYQAFYSMTEYLISKKYQHIAFVSTSSDRRAIARYHGYLTCISNYGLAQNLIALPGSKLDLLKPVAAFSDLISKHPQIDAVCCTNDATALQLLFYCQRNNFRIPEDIAISGFCDLAIASQVYPSLTTVRVPSYDIGKEAAQHILERIAGTVNTAITQDLGFEIIARESA